jgi:hypothetical protein
MHVVKLDFEHGLISVDSALIAADENGVLADSIAKLCSRPIQIDEERTQYRLLKKANVCGKSADSVIECRKGKVFAVTFLFDLIEFFESTILESKTLKACENSSNLNFISNHPSNVFLDSCEWGSPHFFMMRGKVILV